MPASGPAQAKGSSCKKLNAVLSARQAGDSKRPAERRAKRAARKHNWRLRDYLSSVCVRWASRAKWVARTPRQTRQPCSASWPVGGKRWQALASAGKREDADTKEEEEEVGGGGGGGAAMEAKEGRVGSESHRLEPSAASIHSARSDGSNMSRAGSPLAIVIKPTCWLAYASPM